ncbi:MAG: hypothetical protein ACT4PS_11255 [Betaproteobacteria bacterium]
MRTKRMIGQLVMHVALTLAFGTATSAVAQTYPNKPIRIIVPFPAAGNADIVARILGQKMAESHTPERFAE